jgi:hypothetical protein
MTMEAAFGKGTLKSRVLEINLPKSGVRMPIFVLFQDHGHECRISPEGLTGGLSSAETLQGREIWFTRKDPGDYKCARPGGQNGQRRLYSSRRR